MTQTYTATYETGWHATLKDETMEAARTRFLAMGRGEAVAQIEMAGTLRVWGRDEDDEYADGE